MIKERYHDIISKTEKQKETKSGEEIVADIVNRGGLEII